VADENPKRPYAGGTPYSFKADQTFRALKADEIAKKVAEEHALWVAEQEVSVTDVVAKRRKFSQFEQFVQAAPPQPLKSGVAYLNERAWRDTIERYVEQLRKLNLLQSIQESRDFYNPKTHRLNGLKYSELAMGPFIEVPILQLDLLRRAYEALQNGYLMPWTFMNLCFKNCTWNVKPTHPNLIALIDVAPDDWELYLPLFPEGDKLFKALHKFTPSWLSFLTERQPQATFGIVVSRYLDLKSKYVKDRFGPKRSLIRADYHFWTQDVRQAMHALPHTLVEQWKIDNESEVLESLYQKKDVERMVNLAQLPWSTNKRNGLPTFDPHGR
jgi:hypothetical protein